MASNSIAFCTSTVNEQTKAQHSQQLNSQFRRMLEVPNGDYVETRKAPVVHKTGSEQTASPQIHTLTKQPWNSIQIPLCFDLGNSSDQGSSFLMLEYIQS